VTIIFALLSAFSYGYADFVGALAAKKARAIAVTSISLSIGLVIAIVLSFLVGADFSPAAINAGIYAGVASGIALACLYAALALGPISIVSPLTAVASAVIPVVIDMVAGQPLGSFALIAIGVILVAIVLVAFVPGQDVRLPSLKAFLYSLGAGFGFAGIFVFLDSAPSDSGLSTLIVMRVVGIIMMFGLLLIAWLRDRKQAFIEPHIFGKSLIWLIFLAGLGDVTGNVFFLIATREGALAIAAVLTSLYPVGTILLAWGFLKERIALSQSIGIFLAVGACALLAVG
jgi:drug/metabolite transporter (DMT)-like permease